MASLPFELTGKTVYVAGHRGMVGSALVRRLAAENVKLLTASRSEVDLCDQAAVTNGSPPSARRWCFWRPPRSGASSPTTRCALTGPLEAQWLCPSSKCSFRTVVV
jgi:NAD(P)-dependent dehydrogenase (short-subunit alcohol dehydrogenase family)